MSAKIRFTMNTWFLKSEYTLINLDSAYKFTKETSENNYPKNTRSLIMLTNGKTWIGTVTLARGQANRKRHANMNPKTWSHKQTKTLTWILTRGLTNKDTNMNPNT